LDAKARAIDLLLKPPALDYLRTLRSLTEKDPDYLTSNHVDIGNIIHGFLHGSGLLWDAEIFEKEWLGILQEALDRLASKDT